MRHWFSRAWLAPVVGLCILAANAQAGQDPSRSTIVPVPAYQPQVSLPYETQAMPSAAVADPAKRQSISKRIYEKWQHHFGCYTTHNDYGCSTCRSTYIFMFGSCREFFGDSCEKSPPPGPVPPGYKSHPHKGCNSPECLLNR